ncbi:MAG: helix-turn-helix transcriptional regulator [Thalassovita sp.]
MSGSLPQMTEGDTIAAINGIAGADTVESVWARIVKALSAFGFERVNYGYTRYRVGATIGPPEDAVFLSTHSLNRVKEFHKSGLYVRSADFRWVRENVGACPWDWTIRERQAGRLTNAECKAMDELDAARSRAGYTISFPVGIPRSKGAMGMGAVAGVSQSELDVHWERCAARINAIANMGHCRLSQLPLDIPGMTLTGRQREILEWIADGKSMQDVCILTGLSLSTVEKYLRRARDELGVETTAQAVAKVSFFNQLYVSETPSACAEA